MFYVYILKLNNGNYYISFSEDVKKRVKEHQDGKSISTVKYRPIKLVSCILFKNKYKALKFEKYLKSSSGFAFRNKHLL